MSLYKKLLTIQKSLKPIVKDQVNPHFKNTYADINTLLEAIRPVLNENGVVVNQVLTNIEGIPSLTTTVVDVDSAEKTEGTVPLPQTPDAQKMGAAITYFRRYALVSLFCLEAVDDDGESAVDRKDSNDVPFEDNEPAYVPEVPKTASKICPKCKKSHNGTYAKCYDCWKADKK